MLVLVLCLGLFACAPNYEGDERLGKYFDIETDKYRLTLRADGTGTITHTSSLGTLSSEEIVFELKGDDISILGTEENGGVIGRSEYRATFTKVEGFYCIEIKNADSGNKLGTFYRMQKQD